MKHLLLILLFVPLISFGQKRLVLDSKPWFEILQYGEKHKTYGEYVATYYYDGNPFNDNRKSLHILDIIEVTKSDISEEKILFYPFHSKIPFTSCSYYRRWYECRNGCDWRKGIVDETCQFIEKVTYEFIFDNDNSTYFKLDNISAKNIKSLDHELISKFKKHNNLYLRVTYIYPNNTYDMIEYAKENKDYKINLSGFTAAYNKYMNIETPTIKNKNLYKVANGLANVNPFNLDKYIDKFILDAKTNHNIDLSYVNKRDRLILFRELEGETIAAAYKMYDDDSVLVLVDPENWYDANQSKRWYIIYHELGHDILNLEHGECGPMMNERASGNYTWDRLEKDKNTMFETYKSKP